VVSVSFWLEWAIPAPLARLRSLLEASATSIGDALVEVPSIATSGTWVNLVASHGETRYGTIRIQSAEDGCQVVIAPGPQRDRSALGRLNLLSVKAYALLVGEGFLAPPPPMETIAPDLRE
jgi:hypothetical protein